MEKVSDVIGQTDVSASTPLSLFNSVYFSMWHQAMLLLGEWDSVLHCELNSQVVLQF